MKKLLPFVALLLCVHLTCFSQYAYNSLGLGAVDYVEVPDDPDGSLDVPGAFTFEAWIFNFGGPANQKVAGKLVNDFTNGFIFGIEDNQINMEVFDNTGTNFRSALLMAYHRFIKVEASKQKTTRSVVLISDGEDFGENYSSVIERLKKHDIKLYPVGIGTYEGAPVPNSVMGKTEGFMKRSDGTLARSALQDNLLMQLGEEFNTEYVRLDEQIDDLRPVTEQLKLRSASVIDTKIEEVKTNRYQWFLAGSFLLFMASMFLMPIKKPKIIEE